MTTHRRPMSALLFNLLAIPFFGTVLQAEEWNGFARRDFTAHERKGFVIVPKTTAQGSPWIWRTEFFGHEPQADLALLAEGFHIAYIDMQNLYGGPEAMKVMDATYKHLTSEFHLHPKVVLEGFSRGGLFTLNWAARNTDSVACIYNDAPVCDFKSWPGGLGKGQGSKADWDRLKSVYEFANDDEAIAYKLNPIDNLEPLAKAGIPLLHVCGETDVVVPIDENSRVVETRYKELGGSIMMIVKPNCDHHPHSLQAPTRIVNFVLSHTGLSHRVRNAPTPYGYDYFNLRAGLDRCRAKFEKEKTGRVAFLGGSITTTPGWRDMVCEDLMRRFPQTKFDFINAGIPSLGSTPGAFRFERDVLRNGPIDLLFEEAAVNDDTNGFSDVEQVRGMEGIVRRARLENPQVDIVLLHFVDPGKMELINKGQTPAVIRNHEAVAERYQTPSINLAKEVTERIHAGEFTWANDFKDLHPTPFGHELYAHSIRRLLATAFQAKTANPVPLELPAPLDPSSYFHGQLVGVAQAFTEQPELTSHGWKLQQNWTPKDGKATRPGFVNVPVLEGDTVGSTFQYRFKGSAVGLFVAAGSDTGVVEYRIDGGEWKSLDLFTQWSKSLHLPWAKMLAAGLEPKDHVLEVKIADSANPRSVGHAVRIVYFLVNTPK